MSTTPLVHRLIEIGTLKEGGPSVYLRLLTMTQPHVSLTGNDIDGIEIRGSWNASESVVKALRSADGLLPFVVVIRNTGQLPITGIEIRYTVTSQGEEVVNDFFYGSPVDLADSSSIPVIAPGQNLVISPNHLTNEQINWGHLSLTDQQLLVIGNKVDFLNRADEVHISVDSVIRSNGIIYGPDRSGTFRNFQSEISGYTKFRNELLRKLSAGESNETVINWLVQTKDLRLIKTAKNQPLDRGILIQKQLAQKYLAFMETGQRQACWEALNDATPEQALRRINKIRQQAKS